MHRHVLQGDALERPLRAARVEDATLHHGPKQNGTVGDPLCLMGLYSPARRARERAENFRFVIRLAIGLPVIFILLWLFTQRFVGIS